ncbi:MAG: hypothetical protein JWN70_6481 [Planctomycetaceae bacterium]|nr:hypothetical protein [Planctomycetaceae bacterium]
MTNEKKKLILCACLLFAVAMGSSRIFEASKLWFYGLTTWPSLWRPFPDWGSGAELYGALLPAKWNGTRNFWYGFAVIVVAWYAYLFKHGRVVAYFLIEGALISMLDIFWLINGSLQGWVAAVASTAIGERIFWMLGAMICGFYLWKYGGHQVGDELGVAVDASFSRHGAFVYWCYFVGLALAGMKLFFAYRWWFDGINFWSVAFRPFPDWGVGADHFGALLPAKWIGTRNLMYGLIIVYGVWLSYREKSHELLGFLLLQGVFIEFFDGFWLANGKYNLQWEGPKTDFYMYGGFAWGPFLITTGMYLITLRYRYRTSMGVEVDSSGQASARRTPSK